MSYYRERRANAKERSVKKNMVLKMVGKDMRSVGKTLDLSSGDLALNPRCVTLLAPVSSFSFLLKM